VKTQVGWNFWLQWLLAATLGSLVGRTIGEFAGRAVGGPLGAVLAGALVGLCLGVAEAIVFGRYLKAGTRWLTFTIVGAAAGALLGGLLDRMVLQAGLGDLPARVLGLLVSGACLGAGQWWAVRTQYPQFVWWIPACAFALSLTPFADVALAGALSFAAPAVATFVRPLLTAAVTGAAIVWLLNESTGR